jgi:hypothetical protein
MPPRGARGRAAAAAAAGAAAAPPSLDETLAAIADATIAGDDDGAARALQALEPVARALADRGGIEAALDPLLGALASPSDGAVRGALYVVGSFALWTFGKDIPPLLAHPRVPGALAGLLRDPARSAWHADVLAAVYWLVVSTSAAAVSAAIEERGAAAGVEALEAAMADAAAAMCTDNGQAAAAVMQARSPLIRMTQEARSDPLDWTCEALLRLAVRIPGGLAAAQRRLLAHPRLLAALGAAAADPGAAGPPAALVSGAAFDVLRVLCGWNPDGGVRYDGTPAEALRAAPGLRLAAGRLLDAARARGGDGLDHMLLLRHLQNAGGQDGSPSGSGPGAAAAAPAGPGTGPEPGASATPGHGRAAATSSEGSAPEAQRPLPTPPDAARSAPAGSPASLRVCGACGAAEGQGQRLRRCKGCYAVAYCSEVRGSPLWGARGMAGR